MTTPMMKPFTLKRWIIHTTIGWLLGVIFIIGLGIIGESLLSEKGDYGGQAIVGIGMGLGIGLMHRKALGPYLEKSAHFFWLTFLGFSTAFILRDLIEYYLLTSFKNIGISTEATIPFTVILGGFITSWLHYKYIFKNKFDNAIRWVYYYTIAWLLADLITMSYFMVQFKITDYIPRIVALIFAFVFLLVGGPILGYITGLFIVPKVNNENT